MTDPHVLTIDRWHPPPQHAGLLRDDSRCWIELGEVSFLRRPARRTEVLLDDEADGSGPLST
jgi:hypothetical protein